MTHDTLKTVIVWDVLKRESGYHCERRLSTPEPRAYNARQRQSSTRTITGASSFSCESLDDLEAVRDIFRGWQLSCYPSRRNDQENLLETWVG